MKTEEWQEKAIFIDKLRELTDRLNRCRAAYEAHTPLVSDEIYDILFSDLQTLGSWLGLRMKNYTHQERQSSGIRQPSIYTVLPRRLEAFFVAGNQDG